MRVMIAIALAVNLPWVALGRDAADENLQACFETQAAKYDDGRSDARTIALAILGLCDDEQVRLIVSRKGRGYSAAQAQRDVLLPSVREAFIERAIRAVLAGRRR